MVCFVRIARADMAGVPSGDRFRKYLYDFMYCFIGQAFKKNYKYLF